MKKCLIPLFLTFFLFNCGGGSSDENNDRPPVVTPPDTSLSTTLKWAAPSTRVGGYPLTTSEI